MPSIDEQRSACETAQQTEVYRHFMDPPALSYRATYYPFGFPAEVATNSQEVLQQYDEMWGRFEQQYSTEALQVDVRLVEGGTAERPPEPTYRFMDPLLACVADADNYSITNLRRGQTNIVISRGALQHPLYAQYFLLGDPCCSVATLLTTPVHAGCVSLNGRGMLLCGDSGAGKSTLSYACAKAGWTYVTDDASYLLNGASERRVTGNCYQVRFRPSAAELFPEIAGRAITPRAAGKPSIELPTADFPQITRAQSSRVDFIVYLSRNSSGPPLLAPYARELARRSMRQVVFGPTDLRERQHEAIDRLLGAQVFELRYSDLEWAVQRLRTLAVEGR